MLFPSVSPNTLLALALMQPAMALPKLAGNSSLSLTPIANATSLLNRAVPSDLAAAVRPQTSSGRLTAKDLYTSRFAVLPLSTGQLISKGQVSASISNSLGIGHIVKNEPFPQTYRLSLQQVASCPFPAHPAHQQDVRPVQFPLTSQQLSQAFSRTFAASRPRHRELPKAPTPPLKRELAYPHSPLSAPPALR